MVSTVYREIIHTAPNMAEVGMRLAKKKGLQVYAGRLGNWKEKAHLDGLIRLREELDIELEGGWGFDFVHADDEVAKRSLETLTDYVEGCCKPLGIKVIGTCARTTRWEKEPSVEEALERIAKRLAPAATFCESVGVQLALENHADYRGKEIASVIREVSSPGLRARLDTDLEEADRMLTACQASGAKLTISHQRYYMPQYAQARKLIAEGAIGNVRSAEAHLLPSCIHTDGRHTIHMLLCLLGNPSISHLIAQIDAHSGNTYYGHRAEDAGTAFIAFDNQVHAHLSWGLASRDPRVPLEPVQNFRYHRFIIYGDEGRLELDGDAPVGDWEFNNSN